MPRVKVKWRRMSDLSCGAVISVTSRSNHSCPGPVRPSRATTASRSDAKPSHLTAKSAAKGETCRKLHRSKVSVSANEPQVHFNFHVQYHIHKSSKRFDARPIDSSLPFLWAQIENLCRQNMIQIMAPGVARFYRMWKLGISSPWSPPCD